MSKGLGRVERAILEYLENTYDHSDFCVENIAYAVRDILRGGGGECEEELPFTLYVSVCRAVRNLEKKRFVKCSIGDGTHHYYKVVKLLSV